MPGEDESTEEEVTRVVLNIDEEFYLTIQYGPNEICHFRGPNNSVNPNCKTEFLSMIPVDFPEGCPAPFEFNGEGYSEWNELLEAIGLALN